MSAATDPRPTINDADEWLRWLEDHAGSNRGFIAVQIVEAVDEHQKALAREVYGLAEQTAADYEAAAKRDDIMGAFARGRIAEAKSIARAINAIMPYSRDPSALSFGGRQRLAYRLPFPSVFLQEQPDGQIASQIRVPDGISPSAAMEAVKRLHAHLGEEIARAATDCPAQAEARG